MKKTIIVVVVLVVALFVIKSLADNKGGGLNTASEPIKIGVVGPLTGPKSLIGEGLRQAIILAQKDFGPTQRQYQFVFEDSAGEAAKSASAVQKLVSIDKVQALISITSQDGNITNKAAEENHIPHIGMANDHGVSNGRYNFVNWTPIDEQARLFVSELKKRNIKRIAALVEINDASTATMNAFKQYLPGTGIELVYSQEFTKGTNDFRTIIQKMKDARPELVMLEAFSPAIEIIAGQIQELQVPAVVSSITYIGTAQNQAPFEGVWYVSGGQPSAEFAQKFQAQAGYAPTIGSHYGYDVARVFMSVFESASDISGESIAQAITSLDFQKFRSIAGVTGMDADGQFISPAALVVVRNGQPVQVK